MQDFSQMTNADGTELDMKDEDHGLYALMGYFVVYGVRSTVSVAYSWINDTQDFLQTTTANDTKWMI